MTKIAEVSTKTESDAFLFGTYITHNKDNTTIKSYCQYNTNIDNETAVIDDTFFYI